MTQKKEPTGSFFCLQYNDADIRCIGLNVLWIKVDDRRIQLNQEHGRSSPIHYHTKQ